MATQTSHYHWTLPATSDAVDISVLNSNFSGIDDTIYSLSNSINTLSDTIATVSGTVSQISSAVNFKANFNKTLDSGTDLNNIYDPGIYGVYSGYTSHTPYAGNSMWIVYVGTYGSDNYRVSQIAVSTNDSLDASRSEIYVRTSYHSSGSRAWSSWRKYASETVSDFTVTPTANGTLTYAKRFGRIAQIVMDAHNIPSLTWTKIGASSLKPYGTVSIVNANASVSGFGSIRIDSTGDIQAYHTLSTGNNNFFNATLTFLINE